MKKVLISLFVCFGLFGFFNLSYAEFSETEGIAFSSFTTSIESSSISTVNVTTNYTNIDYFTIFLNHYINPQTYQSAYDSAVSELNNSGYNFVFSFDDSTSYYILLILPTEFNDLGIYDNTFLGVADSNSFNNKSLFRVSGQYSSSVRGCTIALSYQTKCKMTSFSGYIQNVSSSTSIKKLTYTSPNLFWDGTYYFTPAPTPTPTPVPTPTPTATPVVIPTPVPTSIPSSGSGILANTTYTKYISSSLPLVDTNIVLDINFITLVNNYATSPDDYEQAFISSVNSILNQTGKSNFLFSFNGSDYTFVFYDVDDFGYHDANSSQYLCYVFSSKTIYTLYFNTSYSTVIVESSTADSGYDFYKGFGFYNSNILTSSIIKNFNALTDIWDGETVISSNYNSEPEPLSHDVTGLISALTSSDYITDIIPSEFRKKYFIVPFGNYYEIYFYEDIVSLSMFEYMGSDNRLYYDLDKYSYNGFIGTIASLFSMSPKYHTVSAYLNSDGTYSFYNGVHFDITNLLSFDSELNPIIYTTHDIPYFYYEYDSISSEWVSFENSSRNIPTTVVTDSDGVEINPVINAPSYSVSQTPWDKLVSAINSIPLKFLEGIKSLFVPEDTFFSDRFYRLQTALNNKLPIVSFQGLLDSFNNLQAGEIAPITFEMYGQTYTLTDFSLFIQYRQTFYNWVRGFCYFFLILYNISQIYKLIRGDTLSGNAIQFGQRDLPTSGKIGFGK